MAPARGGTDGRHVSQLCPRYRVAIEILGKRWTGLILQLLLGGSLRFSELLERLEVVSDRMLSERLKELEEQKIVIRRVLPDPPVRVEYELTDKGRALQSVVDAIGHWAERWITPPSSKGGSPRTRSAAPRKGR